MKKRPHRCRQGGGKDIPARSRCESLTDPAGIKRAGQDSIHPPSNSRMLGARSFGQGQ
jgi:hypothetical protein